MLCRVRALRDVKTSGTSAARPNTLKLRCLGVADLCLRIVYMLCLAGLDFQAALTSRFFLRAELTMHLAVHHFHLAFPLRLFDVGRECKICLSVLGRYKINFGIPPIQYKSMALKWQDVQYR